MFLNTRQQTSTRRLGRAAHLSCHLHVTGRIVQAGHHRQILAVTVQTRERHHIRLVEARRQLRIGAVNQVVRCEHAV